MTSDLQVGYLASHVLLPFGASFLVSVILTALVRPWSRRMGLLDRPGDHKQHAEATPTLGGVPVFLAFVLGCYLSGPLSKTLTALLQASLVLVAVGVADDIWGVRAKTKLATLFFASAWLWKSGLYLNLFGDQGPVALVITFLWVGLVSSAFNGVDNADGAAGGLAALSALITFLISWHTWQRDLAIVSLVLGGASLGFLVFNFPLPRATIFLGDSGSLFLGFGLSSLAILGHWTDVGWKSAIVACLLVFVPLFDFLFILISRGVDGRYRHWEDPIKMCGRDHLFHRLRHLGLGPKAVLGTFYTLAIGAGLAAYLIVSQSAKLTTAGAALMTLAALLLGTGFKMTGIPKDAFGENSN